LLRPGPLAAALLGVFTMSLLSLRSGEAQGGGAALIRQFQSQIASLTQMGREQMLMIQRLNATHTADLQRLQRFQVAVNAAAATGDPTALAIRASSPETALDKLTLQFNTRARKQRAGGPATSTELSAPDLSGGKLAGAVLHGAKLAMAILKGTDLTGADLTNTVLHGANLRGAKLQGTNLTGTDLTNADLTDALYDAHTRWPNAFDPLKHGALLVQ
jgi:uncharacterized protein YjbI with pentapeptide repeats